MTQLTQEKLDIIRRLQEAVGRSEARLRIIKEISKKESIEELRIRLKIPQPTVSKVIARFETYHLVEHVRKKGNSDVYETIPMLKQIGSLDRWIGYDIRDEEPESKLDIRKIKARVRTPSGIPFIDSSLESDALRMSEPYVILFLFENSLRNFIVKVLSDKYGVDWWNKIGIKNEILVRVEGRKKLEKVHKWHVPRGAHEIFYTDLEDLTYFLRKEEPEFKTCLDVGYWVTNIETAIKLSRNIVDHHNPLPNREVRRLQQFLEDWKRQLK